MPTLQRIRVTWGGLGGLPGLSTFYAEEGNTTAVADVKAFFSAIASYFPGGTTWSVPASGDVIDVATGGLVGGWTMAGGGTVTSTVATSSYAAGVGAYVRWDTGVVFGGRRLKGRTFLAPLVGAAYDTNGTLSPTTVTALSNAAGTLRTASAFAIWHRPGVSGTGGGSATISGSTVPDIVTSLRSRRT